jgi:hypothetical protein
MRAKIIQMAQNKKIPITKLVLPKIIIVEMIKI